MKRPFSLPLLVFGVITLWTATDGGAESNSAADTKKGALFGFTPFPYDFTMEAVTKTHETVVGNSTLYALHYDDGVPWKEMLAGAPLPPSIQKKWDDDAHGIPAGRTVYVGLAPLATDRKSLAPSAGDKGKGPVPPELKDIAFDDPRFMSAYLNYAQLAVRRFHPRFLNIGIEAGGVLLEDAKRWEQFEHLFAHVRSQVKKDAPEMQVGISFSLGRLRADGPSKRARGLIAESDFLGLSFYPSASAFDEKFGLPPYGSGSDAWRKPLAWVRSYTDKPIALCETGYTTQNIDLPAFQLVMKGDESAQADYVRELFDIARRDRYAFVVWFLAIDYDKLYAKMPPGSDVMKLWRNVGLIDGEGKPKKAWEEWKKGLGKSLKSE